uniref:Uncharacterized protein n=1 Tax=Hordeum vulgare subsp. vulgare TaxID=112509 RepID=A0A8I6XCC5_HORVV
MASWGGIPVRQGQPWGSTRPPAPAPAPRPGHGAGPRRGPPSGNAPALASRPGSGGAAARAGPGRGPSSGTAPAPSGGSSAKSSTRISSWGASPRRPADPPAACCRGPRIWFS